MYVVRRSLLLLAWLLPGAAPAYKLSGTVTDQAGNPLPGAGVKLSALAPGGRLTSAGEVVTAGADGTFHARVEGPATTTVFLGTGRPWYLNRIALFDVSEDGDVGTFALEALSDVDFEGYQWIAPNLPLDPASMDIGCNYCHGAQERDARDSLMAQAGRDPYVMSLYTGEDLEGAAAGPGFRVEHPDDAGPCANCHTPTAAVDAPGETVLTEVEGVHKEGVYCEACHKIADVVPGDGPGVGHSVRLWRPSPAVGRFCFGPFEDGAGGGPMLSSYSELQTRSRYCAGCHEWSNDNGVPVLSTWSEWSEMAGADPDALQCQDCHMKKKFGPEYRGEPEPTLEFALERNEYNGHLHDMHAVLRGSDTLYPHRFQGALDLGEEAADLHVALEQDGAALRVTVGVENVNAGHALPTGQPFRHFLLVVDATVDGLVPEQTAGPVVPEYGGGAAGMVDVAGLPGKGFARVLGDGTGARNVPFWDATEVLEDTRIAPGETDECEFGFVLPAGATLAEVRTTLVYRRAFAALTEQKGWDFEDVIVETSDASLALEEVKAEDVDGTGGEEEAGSRVDGCECSAAAPAGAPRPLATLVELLAGLGRR